jgi:hypothetical protein
VTIKEQLTEVIHGHARSLIEDFLKGGKTLYNLQVLCRELAQPNTLCMMLDLPSLSKMLDEEPESRKW